jgi:hypothetical protein
MLKKAVTLRDFRKTPGRLAAGWIGRKTRVAFSILLLLDLSVCAPKTEAQPGANRWDSTARYLAGMEPIEDPAIAALSKKPEWQNHRRAMDAMFAGMEATYLSKMRPWAEKEIGDPGTPVLFYPFGGPEIIVSQALFPHVQDYIMFGLEAPGPPPDLLRVQPARMNGVLVNLRNSLDWLVRYTYFQTIHMSSQLRATDVSGTAPLMLVFLARTNNQVTDVASVFLGSDGRLYELDDNAPGPGRVPRSETKTDGIQGVRITFIKDGKERSAFFFSFDATDPAMARRSYFFDFVRSRGQRSVMIKAASYLLHWGNFPTLKSFILNESRLILSDDTGMPFKDYDPGVWNLTFYGNYVAPIPQFAGQIQPALRAVYAAGKGIRPLPFEIGYTAAWKPGISSLILAHRAGVD